MKFTSKTEQPSIQTKQMGDAGFKSADQRFLQELTARNLRIILTSAWWAFFAVFLLALTAGGYRVMTVCFIGAVLTTGLLKMDHRGRTRAVGISSCLLFYLAGSTCLLIGEGFRDEAILVYPAVIIISSLLLNRFWFAVFALLSIGGVFAVGLGEIQGLIVHELSGYTRLSGVLTAVTILAVTTVGVRLLNRGLLNTIAQATHSEGKCRSIFDSSPDGIILTDLNGRIIDANARMRRLSGYTRSELKHHEFRE
ncbi:MAG: PAS domain S-box protein, partial [Thermodesulfobacteriota bacterium]